MQVPLVWNDAPSGEVNIMDRWMCQTGVVICLLLLSGSTPVHSLERECYRLAETQPLPRDHFWQCAILPTLSAGHQWTCVNLIPTSPIPRTRNWECATPLPPLPGFTWECWELVSTPAVPKLHQWQCFWPGTPPGTFQWDCQTLIVTHPVPKSREWQCVSIEPPASTGFTWECQTLIPVDAIPKQRIWECQSLSETRIDDWIYIDRDNHLLNVGGTGNESTSR